jgi:hypothetical protein
MYVIAIHYSPGAGEVLARPLAEALDLTLYEARARLVAPEGGPVVVASYSEIEPAWACAGRLRANNLVPILLTPEDIESDSMRFLVRSFELGEQGVAATSRRGEAVEIAYGDVDLAVQGVRIETRTETETIPGMLKMTRKVKQVTKETRDEFLHLYAPGRPPLAFRAGDINYQSLGPDLQAYSAANFAILTERLRQSLSRGRWDDRLTRSTAHARILGPSLTENHLDIALSLLVRVLRP